MQKFKLNALIAKLFEEKAWDKARRLLEKEREKDPDNHWILTQLGVTWYEQRRYKEALKLFESSQKIVPDCPLTLWNLAGTLDTLGKHSKALRLFTWLLESKTSPEDDPCWESQMWADALKTDCVFRLGVCFRQLGKKQIAEGCLRQYIELLLQGMNGSYSLEDAKREILALHGNGRNGASSTASQKAFDSTLAALHVGK